MTHKKQDSTTKNDTSLPSKQTTSDQSEKQEGGFWEIIRFTVIALAIVIPIRIFIAQPFIVSGESMFPTFENGDYLIIDEISYRLDEPERGDVVVFKYPIIPDRFFIKRIIGLPGETITWDDDTLSATDPNGVTIEIDEPYIEEFEEDDFETTLEDDEYFVMGDNRDASSDSRIWGPLPVENITGRALVRLFPLKTIEVLPGNYQQEDNQEE